MMKVRIKQYAKDLVSLAMKKGSVDGFMSNLAERLCGSTSFA